MWFPSRPVMRLPLFLAAISSLASLAGADETVRIAGSSALVAPFVDAAPVLKNQDIELTVISDSNTPTAIMGVGSGLCEIGLSTRPLQAAERATFPDRAMAETIIGYQALVFSVSNDVWQAGVRSISKADLVRIYESKMRSWKELGGPERRIKFYNPEQGKGMWEFFAGWLYGDMRKAPMAERFEVAGSAEEARNLVEFNGGSLAILPPSRSETPGVHGLAYRDEKGKVIPATLDNVRKGLYPISRPIIAVTAFRPSGAIKKTLDFLISAQGQELVRKADLVSVLEEQTD